MRLDRLRLAQPYWLLPGPYGEVVNHLPRPKPIGWDDHSNSAGIFESAADLRFAKDILLQIGRELYPDAPLGFGDLGALVAFHNTVPNNTLPVFWSNSRVGDKQWKPIFPRP
jgi:hypothetical protein